MNRRQFLASSAPMLTAPLATWARIPTPTSRAEPQSIRVHVHSEQALSIIPRGFIGLAYEIASVAKPGLLSGKNRASVQFARTLGSEGVIRIGGNTLDYSRFSPRGQAVSAPNESRVGTVSA